MITKFGLDYFQVEVHFFNTKNARLLTGLFGPVGLVIYFELMADIFDNGYYLKPDDDYLLHLAGLNGLKKEEVENVIRKLVDLEVYDQSLYEECGVLTSVDIQNHYAIVKKRIPGLKKEVYPYLLIDLMTAFGAQKKAYCRRREKGQAKRISEKGGNGEVEVEDHSANEDVANNADVTENNSAKTKREKKRTKRKENELKGSEEKRRIKIKNNFYIERDSRSLYACDHAHEGERETFRNKIRSLIFNLLKDKEWCRAACANSNNPDEYAGRLNEKLQKYYDYIIITGGEDSLENDDDFKRRFFFWQKKHDSVNETDSQNEKKENVPAATKVSRTDEARLLQEKSMEIIKQKLKAQCTNPK